MKLQSKEKYQDPKYRNPLHYAPSYNTTILLRAFDLTDLNNAAELNNYRTPETWDKLDNDTMVVLAATGGTHNFSQRFGLPSQISDAFIESLTISYNLGMTGLTNRTTSAGTTVNMTVKEPNGMNFLPAIMAAFLRANQSDPINVLGSMHKIPILLSVYFNLADGADLSDGGADLQSKFKEFTRHIPVLIQKVNFDITASGTTYTLELLEIGTTATSPSAQRALYESITEIRGLTIGDYLRDLIKAMNVATKNLNKDKSTDYEYEIEFLPGPNGDGTSFENSLLTSAADGSFNPKDKTMVELGDFSQLTSPPTVSSNGKNISYAQVNFTGTDPVNPRQTVAESIAKAEGTLRGAKDWPAWPTELPASLKKIDFDAYFGYKTTQIGGGEVGKILATIGNNKPISQMNLGQIKLFQEDVLTKKLIKVKTENNDNEPTSPAVGGYQFIYSTLFGKEGNGGLAKGIPLSQIFTPQLQTELAKKLFDGAKGNNKTLSGQWAFFSGLDPQGGADLRAQGAGKVPGLNYPGSNSGTNSANVRILAHDIAKRVKTYKRNDKNSVVTIGENQTVRNVVELLALNSEYMRDALKDVDTAGAPAFLPFVKVYTTVDFVSAAPTERNTLKQKVTFHIIPIRLPANTEGIGVSDDDDTIKELERSTIREYNYLFTGKNIDVLDLNLRFENIVNASHIAYKKLTETTASGDRTTVSGDTASASVADNKSGPAGGPPMTGTNQSSAGGTLPESGSAGLPKAFTNVEAEFRALLPGFFGGSAIDSTAQGDLYSINLEIIGDPQLMPSTESSISSTQFKNNYGKYDPNEDEYTGGLHGYGPVHFRLIFGNPDSSASSMGANLYGGYYVYQKVVANFKSSGAFTMNIEGTKNSRGFVVSKATVNNNLKIVQDRQAKLRAARETDRVQNQESILQQTQQQIEQTGINISNNLSSNLLNPEVSSGIAAAFDAGFVGPRS